ncbi:MAG TPA: SRPBCC family protein [Anaerolineales bacterium]|nr:SRPBCC family protein [Anaerolineales bacterium]HNE04524.1 SRPBCC family protein [Anaerolineales bacterium]HNM36514.1 SRPBCC family protein [Anaerolineales bacterium]
MTKISTSLTINASQEAIWKVLSDVAHWQEWTPTVTKVEMLDTPEIKLGNHYKVIQPKLQPVVWTVTELNSANFTWESKSPGMHMEAEHVVKSINANQSEVTLTFAFNGWLGNLIGRMYGKMTEEYIRTEAQSLKKKAESA